MTDFEAESLDSRGRTEELEARGLSSDRLENSIPNQRRKHLKQFWEGAQIMDTLLQISKL